VGRRKERGVDHDRIKKMRGKGEEERRTFIIIITKEKI